MISAILVLWRNFYCWLVSASLMFVHCYFQLAPFLALLTRKKIQALVNQEILHGWHVSATKYTNTTASANTNTHDVVNQEIGQCWHVSACPGRQMTEIFDSLSLEVVNICPNTPGKMQLLFNKEKLNHICNGSGFKSLKTLIKVSSH